MAVAEHLNFTKAAHQLCLTQSAVSYQIAALERELGVQLFRRAPNSVHFTPEGQHFWEGVHALLGAYQDLVGSTQRLASGASRHLNVGFLGGVAKRVLPPVTKRFREHHPEAALRVSRFDMVPLSAALEKGELDLAFTLALALPRGGGLRSELLFRERLVVVMPSDHRLSARTQLAFEDLRGEAFVDLLRPVNGPAYELLVDVCSRRGFVPRIVERFPDLESLFLAIESGEGICVFPKYRGDEQLNERLTYVPLTGKDSTTDCVVAWRATNPNPLLAEFLRELGVRP